MGKIGRYLNALPDDARDRVLTGQDWNTGDFFDKGGARCLVGHAEDWSAEFGGRARHIRTQLWVATGCGPISVGGRFDRLAERVGLARAVQLVKQRAGKRTRLVLTEPTAVAAPTREAQLVG